MAFVTLYPLDLTGLNPSSRIVDELVAVMPPDNITEQSFFIPQAHPFYSANMQVRTGPNGTGIALTEGVDFAFFAKFHHATVSVGAAIYSGIRMLNRNYTGNLYLTYQTLGGNFTFDNPAVLEELIRQFYQVLVVTYDQIQGVPELLPITPHDHDIGENPVGFDQVKDSLIQIRDTLQNLEFPSVTPTSPQITADINLLKAQVQSILTNLHPQFLNSVQGLQDSDAQFQQAITAIQQNLSGLQTSFTLLGQRVTPLETASSTASTAITALQGNVNSLTNRTTTLENKQLPIATFTQRGIVELATSAETGAGTSDETATTPAGVRALVDAYRLIGNLGNNETLQIPIKRSDNGNASAITLKYGEDFVSSGETIVYPVEFANATRVIVACQTESTGTLHNVSVGAQSATGFVVFHTHNNPISIAYFAIGY